ncbi:MAG TPA: peptidoglycan DD-metalloendopeptidase family protein [Pseudomonadales bacterium]|nr:peptidoglycan DD-metalloendopeptidase family protein [Pseudomonadales bacterium]
MSTGCGTKNCRSSVCPWSRLLSILFLSLLLGACKSSSHLAPVEQLNQPPDIKLNYHTVSRNDTLYSIAWRYGADYHELANINNIRPPYTILAGQKIYLTNNVPSQARSPVSAGSSDVTVAAIPDSGNGVTEVTAVSEINPASTNVKTVANTPSEIVKQSVEPVVKQNSSTVKAVTGQWIWPTNGHIISRYSSSDPLRKGIDLEGKLGDSVVAAKSGDVVYAGGGLAGYGELIIVKHDEQFLSAYGHNSRLLVKEGDVVKVGQKIAEVGSSGTDKNQLHFEIRRDGKPVDPLQYLPGK